ncbi:MAG: BREX-1 system adenine-specific DNA-methyltransferase PglX, partial [Propionibacteriaceae bacterium]|nr:BREX-1 system adenine-specific DNA-methyltransferase PglX [Propionibacteriaceae bacterium]
MIDTKKLEAFAAGARTQLIRDITARITTVLGTGSAARIESPQAVSALEAAVITHGGSALGRQRVAEEQAYIWFNRIVGLRFMDANDYTPTHVVSPEGDRTTGQPAGLAAAKRGEYDKQVFTSPATIKRINALLLGTITSTDPQGEAYGLILNAHCAFWNQAMPFMFARADDYTNLLKPADLLSEDSVLSQAVKTLTKEDCQDVEVIGWLYQYYIARRKDEVFASFKKGDKAGPDEIPAATQLFTPDWIVRYLIQNSVGRLWMLNHPDSKLIDQMEYYIAPVDDPGDFQITRPEELTVMDPACGSGHMLTYAFDLLYAIYEEEGYTPSDIPTLILTNNLYGCEIDGRAGALAAFALTMKARVKQRRFLQSRVQPNICVIEPINFDTLELSQLVTKDGDKNTEEQFWKCFTKADTFGSLIRPNAAVLPIATAQLDTIDPGMLSGLAGRATQVIEQATYLTRQYAVVVANPPYMGSKQMNPTLSQFMKEEYPTGKADLMTAFMVRAQTLSANRGVWAMINLPSWMSLKSFEALRHDLLRDQRIVSMVDLGRGVFGSDFGTVAFVIDNTSPGASRGVYRRLFEQHVNVRSVAAIETLFRDITYNRYEVPQADFAVIPGSPIVYWLSEKMRESFSVGTPLSEVANLRQGLATADNSRFLREWWEVSQTRSAFACMSREEAAASGARWFPYNKGGDFRKWYGNQEHVVNWE